MTISLEKIVPTALGDLLKREDLISPEGDYAFIGVYAGGITLKSMYEDMAKKVPANAIIVADCVPNATIYEGNAWYFASGTIVLPVKKDRNAETQ